LDLALASFLMRFAAHFIFWASGSSTFAGGFSGSFPFVDRFKIPEDSELNIELNRFQTRMGCGSA
jgi:hypothetical protein